MNQVAFRQWCQSLSTLSFTEKPLVMGILNVTTDSFSDGAAFFNRSSALQRAEDMLSEGADLIDVGGESSRPGAKGISSDEEIDRIIPVIECIRAVSDVCISVDTCKPVVMRAAVQAGASLINDITALSHEDALSVVAELNVPVCLMHMQGVPQTMQDNPQYANDLIDEINQFFHQRIEACLRAGIPREHVILDPGFGFGKSVTHNLYLVNQLALFQKHQRPLLLGVSRKSTIGIVLQQAVSERLIGGVTLAIFAAMQGISMIRTHDVKETKQALDMLQAVLQVQKHCNFEIP